ncbi:SDR family oxidoreductase [Arthrobacter echini]|uniref:SDR family oxidoreductase n=1 Tax=Arthrobacter echini TaxID=1529066 RepID=A0A4S5E6F9_9MICC|nr:SDR family oxidoreductase [Arthrobacter echini]THJ67033.1 SDR family oxidoreductase [Arthrobacter echini]
MAGTILITGAGTGFGKEAALRLAAQGEQVIAGVEIIAQVTELRNEARQRGVDLRVEKLDVTDAADRTKAWAWDVEVLLNNAAVAEGGAVVDLPEEQLRRQFEVNVFGTMLLTQGFARAMAAKRSGKIVFLSSTAGLITDAFTGAYSASKHALEAFADALHQELAEFGVAVATINPGPYLTGFNDTAMERWKEWRDDPSRRLFDYSKLAFPREQFDPEPVFEVTVAVLNGENTRYRNVVPDDMVSAIREQLDSKWEREQNDGSTGSRSELVEKAYDIAPATPAD